MADRKKVIKGLECCTDGFMMCKRERCPYYGKAPIDSTCRIELEKDALALLKEQEPISPDYDPATLTWSCGNCGQAFDRCKNKFCRMCGRKVNWDE